MDIKEYRVGLVISRCGVTAGQHGEVISRLNLIARAIAEDARIELYVPGYAVDAPELSVGPDIRGLGRKSKVNLTFIGVPHGTARTAEQIYKDLDGKSCDEVWCCPADGQRANSVARVAQVWRLGQAGWRPERFKLIPPWTEAPISERETKTVDKQTKEKGNKQWNKSKWN